MFATMMANEKSTYESVKHSREVVDLVRKNKTATGVPVGLYYDNAVREKLLRDGAAHKESLRKFLVKEVGIVKATKILDRLSNGE